MAAGLLLGVLALRYRTFWVADGHSNKGIARSLEITEWTVKAHLKSILRKIGAHNRTQAAVWALRHDICVPRLSSNGRGSVVGK